MTAPTAGWYADPNGGAGLRFWDGTGWTGATQPSPTQSTPYGQPAPYSGYPGSVPPGQNPSQAYPPAHVPAGQGGRLWAQNKTSFITVGICIVYLAIASFSNLVFFGILPVLYTVRSFQAKESLAFLAALVTVATIGFSIWRTTH